MECAVQVKFHRWDAYMPQRSTEHAMGYDLFCVPDEDFTGESKKSLTLQPGDSHVFHTGLSMAIEEGFGCLLWDRSGMGAKRRIHRLAGVIDSDYRGEWMVSLINLSGEPQTIWAGDRIVQAVFTPQVTAHMQQVEKLSETVRGIGGFGSTGD